MPFLGCQNSLKYVIGRCSAPNPIGKTHSALSNFLVALRGPICKRRERKEKGGKKEREEKGMAGGGNLKGRKERRGCPE